MNNQKVKKENNQFEKLFLLRLYGINLILLILLIGGNLNCYSQTQRTWKWVNQLGGPSWDVSTDIIADGKDNLYIAGRFSETIECAGKKVNSYGVNDIFLAKFDTKGNIKELWNYGGKGNDQASCITSSIDNAVVLGGTISDSVSFGKLKLAGRGLQVFVSTVDNKGRVSWVSSLQSLGKASLSLLKTDTKGYIFAAGSFSGTLVSGKYKITSKGLGDIFLLKISPYGVIEKLISYGSDDVEFLTSLSVDNNGNLEIAGNFIRGFTIGKFLLSPAKAKSNLFIAKINADLEPQGVQLFSALDYGNIFKIKHDNSNNLYVAGSFNMELNMGDTTLKSEGYTDGFVAKLSQEGKLKWARNIGSDYYDFISGINIDNVDGVILTGSIGDTLKIDSLEVKPQTRGDAAFILQLNEGGTAVWSDFISGAGRNFSNGSTLDKNGNLYLCGSFQKSFKREDGELISKGDQDIFLARYYNCPDEELDFKGDEILCSGLKGEIGVSNRYKSIIWNDTIVDKHFIVVSQEGKNWASILTKKGCRYTDTIYISNAPVPDYFLGNDTGLLVIDTLKLKPKDIFMSYHWSNGSYEPSVLAFARDYTPETRKYSLAVSDSLGCNWADTILISFLPVPDITDYLNLKLVTYPNPVIREVNWYLDSEITCRLTIELTNKNGHCLYVEQIPIYTSGQVKTISMERFPVGSYIIRIKNTKTGKLYSATTIIKQ